MEIIEMQVFSTIYSVGSLLMCLELKEEAYSLSGTLMTTTYIPKYTEVKGRYVFAKQLVIDEFEKDNKSLLELSGISLKTINNAVFTKAYLESLSK